jgi:hypothetical protein
MIVTTLYRRFWHAASALLLLAFLGAAQADTYDLGPLAEFPQSHDFLITHAPGDFKDFFYFDLDRPLRATNTAVSLNLRFNAGSNYDISALDVAFYDLSNTFYGIATGIGSPREAVWEQTLLPGGYYAAVSGFANGSAGGKYAYSITAAAVPEPAQWLLMLLGLAAVGFAAKRC